MRVNYFFHGYNFYREDEIISFGAKKEILEFDDYTI